MTGVDTHIFAQVDSPLHQHVPGLVEGSDLLIHLVACTDIDSHRACTLCHIFLCFPCTGLRHTSSHERQQLMRVPSTLCFERSCSALVKSLPVPPSSMMMSNFSLPFRSTSQNNGSSCDPATPQANPIVHLEGGPVPCGSMRRAQLQM